MEEKHKNSAPYHIFYNAIPTSPKTLDHPLSITFQDLLDPSFGSLEMSLQSTYKIDIDWILREYDIAGYGDKPLTIMYGDKDLPMITINQRKPNVEVYCIKTPSNNYGHHHTKLSIFCYKDGSLRVVVSTANLIPADWEFRTQGLWVSPKCPRLDDTSDIEAGESPTGFKSSLLEYFLSHKMHRLNKFVDKIKHADFSAINVFFVASVPGFHCDNKWALLRIRDLLSKYCVIPQSENEQWDLVIQSTGIGKYGTDPSLWLFSDFMSNFCNIFGKNSISSKNPSLKFIYPSDRNFSKSNGFFSISYESKVHSQQLWLEPMLHQWSAENSGRSRALPHMKSYLRISPDAKRAAYYLLTSANASKMAWGTLDRSENKIRVSSYEAGILFIPKFVVSKDFFSIDLLDDDKLPMPYDLPPIPYSPNDHVYIQNNNLDRINKMDMAKKHARSAPYHIFYNAVTSAPNTYKQPLSITFSDLLDHNLGSLEMSLQITHRLDIVWLLSKYDAAGFGDKPLTIVHGDDDPVNMLNLKKQNVEVCRVQIPSKLGTHHSKISIFCYEDGCLRIVVSTANLKAEDWEYRTQGLWMSPKCPPLADSSDFKAGESPTGFKKSLLDYMDTYKMPCFIKFADKIKRTDFSAINVFFVGSVPRNHRDDRWALTRIGDLLSKHCAIPQRENEQWDLIVQSSSVGSYGGHPSRWLCGDFLSNFCTIVERVNSSIKPNLKFIYPSKDNYLKSNRHFAVSYAEDVHYRQRWLEPMLHQWSAVNSDRNTALPHMKSYLRISPDAKRAAYYLLTSANASKSAWGCGGSWDNITVSSYEAGVLFVPKFVVSKDFFTIDSRDENRLPVPYDLPPIPYSSKDQVYTPFRSFRNIVSSFH